MNIYSDISRIFSKLTLDGGPGSGNFSHNGRPGKIGGSQVNPSSNNPPDKRIYGAKRLDSKKERQQYKEMSPNIKKVYDNYLANEQKVTTHIEKSIKSNGLKMVGEYFALKMPSSVIRKVNTDMKDKGMTEDEAMNDLHDICRYTALSSANNLVANAKKTLGDMENQGYKIVQVKNSWLDKTNPYHGINCKLISPDGVKMELQFHTPQSFDMKEHKQHKLYEVFRDDKATDEEKEDANRKMWALINNNLKWNVPKDIDKI